MASMHPPLVLAPYSPSLPEFETDLSRLRDTQYLGTLEADLEHSRDLYLQGAMAIGQIARLLEELCADYEPENTEGVIESVPFEDASYATSVNYQERKNILAWAQTVSRSTSLKNDGITVGADFQAQECREEIHPPESSVVDDMLVIEDHINGIHEDVTNGKFPTRPTMQVSTTTLLETADEKQFDLALRISNLSARLDRLGADIDEFSNERCDALTRWRQRSLPRRSWGVSGTTVIVCLWWTH